MKVLIISALLVAAAVQGAPPAQLTLRCEMTDVLRRPDGVDFYSIDFDRRIWCRMISRQCDRVNDLYGADVNRIKLSAGVEIDRMTGRLTDIINYRNGQCGPVAFQALPARQRF